MRGGGWLRLAAAALLPLALVNNALVNNAATCPRHHLLGMGDELREEGYIGLPGMHYMACPCGSCADLGAAWNGSWEERNVRM